LAATTRTARTSRSFTGGGIASGLQTRLTPLYDLVSTVYYPELSSKMAMKLGGEYSSERISPKNFERLAEEAGLAKPMTKRRVVELAETILSTLPTVTSDHPVTASVAKLLQGRCECAAKGFKAAKRCVIVEVRFNHGHLGLSVWRAGDAQSHQPAVPVLPDQIEVPLHGRVLCQTHLPPSELGY
jgi:hypothetical protein